MYLQVCKNWVHILKKNRIRRDWGRMQPPKKKKWIWYPRCIYWATCILWPYGTYVEAEPWQSLKPPLKPLWNPLQAPLEARPLKPPLESPFKPPPSSPLQAPFKPASSPLRVKGSGPNMVYFGSCAKKYHLHACTTFQPYPIYPGWGRGKNRRPPRPQGKTGALNAPNQARCHRPQTKRKTTSKASGAGSFGLVFVIVAVTSQHLVWKCLLYCACHACQEVHCVWRRCGVKRT